MNKMSQTADRLPMILGDVPHPAVSPDPASPVLRPGYCVERFALPESLKQALRPLALREQAAFDSVLLAAFTALLHRRLAQDEIVVAGVSTRRPQRPAEASGWGGVTLRTLPSGDVSFRAHLSQVRRALRGALDAAAAPPAPEASGPQADRSGDRHRLPRISFLIETGSAPPGVVGTDLHLEPEERPERLGGRLFYRADLFEADAIQDMIGQLVALLHGAAADPDCPLGTLPLLSEAASQRLRLEWDTTRPLPELTLHAGFAVQLARAPDAPAVECEGVVWSFRELDCRSRQLAARLAASGAGPGTLAAICLERSHDLVAGLLAILRTGAAYLPLDPALPPARLALIAEDARPTVLLTTRALQVGLPPTDARIVLAEEGDPAEDVAAADAGIDPASLAYVLYTSGSTGRPKGVEVPHRAVMNLLAAMQLAPGFDATDSLLAVTTVSFDIAVLELFLPLLTGGRVVIASRDAVLEPRRLAALLQRSRCTVMQATPATWRGLLETGWAGDPDLRILCGGEAMPRDLADRLLPRCAALWNLYGPTETTIWSTIHRVSPGPEPVPVGRAIDNTRTYVVDQRGALVPNGIVGELLIGGLGVARGYRGNPTLTAERFFDSPFTPAERVYRTGDLVRRRHDGAIEWLARADSQIKIRGFRIEVQEIEDVLERHPDVLSAAVKAWPDTTGQLALAAYLVTRTGELPELKQLRAFLRGELPDYMVPARYLPLAALPLTPSRKLDRNALPKPGQSSARSGDCVPVGMRECRLAALWEELLDLHDLGRHDSFFDLGGDSLQAVTLLVRIEAQFDRRLTLATLFQTPTIASMAALLGQAEGETQLPLVAAIQPRGSRPRLFWIDGGPMFLPLSRALGSDQPFLGVTLNPAELREVGPGPDLETIARHLVRTLRTLQPDGPYLLGGYCAGGVLAYEVASQLVAAGQTVPLLCLIDAQNPVDFRRVGSPAEEFAKFRHHLHATLRAGRGSRWRYLAEHARSAYRRILSRSPWHAVMTSQPFTLGEIMQPAADAYRPRPYPGTVALFQARRPKQLDLRPGWAKLVGGPLLCYDFPGAHGTMLDDPQVVELARLMEGCLDRADDPARAGIRPDQVKPARRPGSAGA